jgi:hypothetical protein
LGRHAVPVILLIVALAGIVKFSQGLSVLDTVGLLASGIMAGASLASLAAARRRGV